MTTSNGFQIGGTPWNKNKDIRGDRKYDGYRKKLRKAAFRRNDTFKKGYVPWNKGQKKDMPRTWASDRQPKSWWARIKQTFGIVG